MLPMASAAGRPSCRMSAVASSRVCFSPPPPRLVLRREPIERGVTPGFPPKSMTLHEGILVRYLGQSVGEGGGGVAVGRNCTCEEVVMRPVVDATGHKSAEAQLMTSGDGPWGSAWRWGNWGKPHALPACLWACHVVVPSSHAYRRPSRYSLCWGNRVCMQAVVQCSKTTSASLLCRVASSRRRCPAGIPGFIVKTTWMCFGG